MGQSLFCQRRFALPRPDAMTMRHRVAAAWRALSARNQGRNLGRNLGRNQWKAGAMMAMAARPAPGAVMAARVMAASVMTARVMAASVMTARVMTALAMTALVVMGTARLQAAELSSADKARLVNLVREDCGSCHGLTLKGGLGKPLTPDHLKVWSHEQIVLIILDGVPGTPMPPWRPLLSEDEAAWIATRLQQGDLP